MTVPAFHVEAKLHAFRKTQDGVVVSFVVSPIDMPPALALDPLGTRYMLALAEIGDDEKPLERREVLPVEPAHKPVATRPPSLEAGASTASQRGKERYAASTPEQQAVMRACILCGDHRFRKWLMGDDRGEDRAATALRGLLGISSRTELATNRQARAKFLELDTEYQIRHGLMASPR